MKLMESKNLILKFLMRQKIKGAVEDIFQQDQLKDIDKRLIRGVYQRKIKDDMKKERALNNIQKLFGKHLKSAKAIEEQPDAEAEQKQTQTQM